MRISSGTIAQSPYDLARSFELENGLSVVLVPFGVAPVATVAVLYRVGSRNEGLGVTGSAHLLEHMLFKGTPANNPRIGRNYADLMLEIGAAFNATTSYDRTLYYQTIPQGYVEFALELEADRMRDAFVADEDRRFEMTVVRNEFERAKSRPGSVLAIETVATAFREHPYHHPPIGWQSDVEAVSTDRLRAMYHAFYRPDNATLFVAGAFDADAIRAAIERTFARIERPRDPIDEVYTSEPAQTGERSVTVKWRGETSLLRLAYRTPGALGQQYVLPWHELVERAAAPNALADAAAFAMLDSILAGGATSRLSRSLVDTKLCVGVGVDTWTNRDPGLMTVGATLAHGTESSRVMEVIAHEFAELANDGPTEDELARAKRRHAAAEAFRLENCAAVMHALAEAETCGSWRAAHEGDRAIERVTCDQVRALVNRVVHDDSRTIGTLVPGDVRTFSFPLAPLASAAPPPYVPPQPVPEPRDTRVPAFASRIVHGELGPRIAWTAFDEPASGVIELRARVEAGPNFSERPTLANLVATMLGAGTLQRDRIEIERDLSEAGASRGYGCDDRASLFDGAAFRFSGSCVRDGFETLLAVLAEELSNPAFSVSELERIKLGYATRARQSRTSTAVAAQTEFSRLAYAPSDPNYEPSIDEVLADLETITIDDVREYYSRVVLGGSVTIAVSGGFDGFASLEGRLRDAFGSSPLASVSEPAPVRRTSPLAAAERFSAIAIADMRNVDIRIGRATSLARTDDAWMPAAVANAILGGSSLSGRLGRRLRVEEGLTYGIGSSFMALSRDPSPWRIALGVNPDNVERAVSAVRDVVTRFAHDGATDREIEAAKNGIAGSTILTTSTGDGIARLLLRMAYFGLGDDYIDRQRERLLALERAAIEAATAVYLTPNDLIVVTAGPGAAE